MAGWFWMVAEFNEKGTHKRSSGVIWFFAVKKKGDHKTLFGGSNSTDFDSGRRFDSDSPASLIIVDFWSVSTDVCLLWIRDPRYGMRDGGCGMRDAGYGMGDGGCEV